MTDDGMVDVDDPEAHRAYGRLLARVWLEDDDD